MLKVVFVHISLICLNDDVIQLIFLHRIMLSVMQSVLIVFAVDF